MAITSGMFNSINGDRRYEAKWFAQYFASFIGNGVFPNPSTNLQIVEGTGLQTIVKPGKGWINGYFIINDSDYVLQHDLADGVLNRIDRIVMRLNHLTRQIEILIKKGNFSSNPVAPTLQRDGDYYELGLADVYISRGATQILQAYITDLRMNSNYCGIVAGVVQQIDVSSVFNQYQDWFTHYSVTKAQEFHDWQTMIIESVEAWIDAQEQDFLAWRKAEEQLFHTWLQGRKDGFDEWFATVRDILNSTADGNLLNRLQDHEEASTPHKFTDSVTGVTYKWGMGAENGVPFLLVEEVG